MNETVPQPFDIELPDGRVITLPAPLEHYDSCSDGSGRGWDEVVLARGSHGVTTASLTRTDGENFWSLYLALEEDQRQSTAERQNELARTALLASHLLLALNGASLG